MNFLRSFVWRLGLLLAALYVTVGMALIAKGDCYVPPHYGHRTGHHNTYHHSYDYYDFNPVVLFQFVAGPTAPPPVAFTPSAVPVPASQGLSPADRAAIAAEVVRQLKGANGVQTPQATVPPRAKAADRPPADAGELILRGAQIVTTRCAECHTEPGRGKVAIFDQSGAFTGKVSWKRIYAAVEDDSMPKNPNKLSAGEKRILALLAGKKE